MRGQIKEKSFKLETHNRVPKCNERWTIASAYATATAISAAAADAAAAAAAVAHLKCIYLNYEQKSNKIACLQRIGNEAK